MQDILKTIATLKYDHVYDDNKLFPGLQQRKKTISNKAKYNWPK